MDEELRQLEQATRASPDDVAAAVRLGLALARSGDPERAAFVLADAVDRSPSNGEVLRALDSVAPGGLDPRSPWPCSSGDARRSQRARVRGPALRGIVRHLLEYEIDLRHELAVDVQGRLLATYSGGPEITVPPARELNFEMNVELDFFQEATAATSRLWAVTLEGALQPVVGESQGGSPTVLVARLLVRQESALTWRDASGREGRIDFANTSLGLAALGHVVLVAPDRVEAFALGALDGGLAPARWHDAIEGTGAVALGDDAEVVVHARSVLARVDLATGERRSTLELVPDRPAGLIVGEDGWAFLARGGDLFAVRGEHVEWQHEAERPLAIAGARADVLVVQDLASDDWLGLEAKTGRPLWRTSGGALQGSPRVDRDGRIYARRGEHLVAFDEGGEEIGAIEVGGGWVSFAFAAEGVIALLRRTSVTRTQLVVIR